MRLVPSVVRLIACALLLIALLVKLDPDVDGDGVWRTGFGAVDCDDGDPHVFPDAADVPLNGVDEDCDGMDSGTGSNVVLLTIDTLRADNLGAFGYERDTSPTIDALARTGTLFLNAYSPAPWTIPSLASLLTSKYPSEHGARHPSSKLDGSLETLAEVLRASGYRTAAFVHSAYPVLEMGFDQGFELHKPRMPGNTVAIRTWLEAHAREHFFLWVHLADPHCPYIPPPEYEGLFVTARARDERDITGYWNTRECAARYRADRDGEMARDRLGFYDETIRESDRRIGEILNVVKELGLTERTLVVLTADHGEEFFEHGGCDHGQTLYDEVLHVPLVFNLPGVVPTGSVVRQQVRLLDVAPTILALVGLGDRAADLSGVSLVGRMRGEGSDLPVVSGFLQQVDGVVAIRQHGFKYVYASNPRALRGAPRGGEELYDLEADPREQHNLAPGGHPRLAEFREKTQTWLREHRDGGTGPSMTFNSETAARLRALGYVINQPPH